MISFKNPSINHWRFFVIVLAVLFLGQGHLSLAKNSSDAIAVRIFANPKHYSAREWYRAQGFNGSPQSLIVDGYEGVRDGRTVYINVANVDLSDKKLYTNIYLISYTQNAEQSTIDIFGHLLNTWKFNSNLTAGGFCRANPELGCMLDSECPAGDFCDSPKARVIRDVRRLADLAQMSQILEDYHAQNRHYPPLNSGSFIPQKTLSVWPSWQNSLGRALQTTLPTDPINNVGVCDPTVYDTRSCWDALNKRFVTNLPELPPGAILYMYAASDNVGSDYYFCATLESGLEIVGEQYISPVCSDVCLDFDGDGYGNPASPKCANDRFDCNDSNAAIFPGAAEICGNSIDENCDGADQPCTPLCEDKDGDNYGDCSVGCGSCAFVGHDCDDANSAINPGATEICDNQDNNCDGNIDEGCDNDNDNYCDCTQTMGAVATIDTCPLTDLSNFSATCDCKDDSGMGTINPGAEEICDGADNDCDGAIDEGCNDDGDNYCDCGMNIAVGADLDSLCPNTINTNAVTISSTCDCNDSDININPGATEICGNGIDEDCSGVADLCAVVCGDGTCDVAAGECSVCAADCSTETGCCNNNGTCEAGENSTNCPGDCPACWDNDGDGHADESCGGDDCDDSDNTIYPGATEVCDDKDNDCRIATPDGSGEFPTPLNSKQQGVCSGSLQACLSGTWTDNYGGIPGYEAVESSCTDGLDNDCDGNIDGSDSDCAAVCDADGDGALNSVCGGSDCNDADSLIYPGATEICDGKDNDCDGSTPDGSGETAPLNTKQANICAGSRKTCSGGGWVDDYSSVTNYETTESSCADTLDNDCDGAVDFADSDCTAGCDEDGDSHFKTSCGGDDCNDNPATGGRFMFPGNTNITCDGLDNDCDGGGDDLEGCDDDLDGYCDAGMQMYNSNSACPNTPFLADGQTGDDCNDNLATGGASIHPGATEICDGIDNDCDGAIDEGFTAENCEFVCTGGGFTWLNLGAPYNCCGNDTGEAGPYEATESSCADGHDNDCDGKIDCSDSDCSGSCLPGCLLPFTLPCNL